MSRLGNARFSLICYATSPSGGENGAPPAADPSVERAGGSGDPLPRVEPDRLILQRREGDPLGPRPVGDPRDAQVLEPGGGLGARQADDADPLLAERGDELLHLLVGEASGDEDARGARVE